MSEKRQVRLSIISIWIGVTIPIVAALIPYAYGFLSPDHDLIYEVQGPLSIGGLTVMEVAVTNEGRSTEKNVQLQIDSSPYSRVLEEALSGLAKKLGQNEPKHDPESDFKVESKAEVSIAKKGNVYILGLGDLRPDEVISLTLSSPDVTVYRSTEIHGMSIKSDDHVARLRGQSDLEQFIYPFGFWMFVLLMILLLVAGLYQEYLMDPATREKWLLKEIDKLARK